MSIGYYTFHLNILEYEPVLKIIQKACQFVNHHNHSNFSLNRLDNKSLSGL